MTTINVKGDMPVVIQLKPIKVGADYAFTLYFKDDNRAARDTTGWTMEMKGRENNARGEVVFSLTTVASAGITHTPAEGKFAVKIAKTISALFDVGVIAFDIKVTDSNSDVIFPIEGKITVLETVTR